jgi:hypothetical protein
MTKMVPHMPQKSSFSWRTNIAPKYPARARAREYAATTNGIKISCSLRETPGAVSGAWSTPGVEV